LGSISKRYPSSVTLSRTFFLNLGTSLFSSWPGEHASIDGGRIAENRSS
jgi:hypothetical protein